jgi:copper(I)-binding protein
MFLARLLFLFAIVLSVPYAGAAQPRLGIRHPWILEAPPTASTLAGYMLIENHGLRPRKLVAAESTAFESVELHRSMVKNGIASMAPQDALAVPAHGQVALEPGGYHLMMIEPAKCLRAGDKVKVDLIFDGDERVRKMFSVKKATGGGHFHHHPH